MSFESKKKLFDSIAVDEEYNRKSRREKKINFSFDVWTMRMNGKKMKNNDKSNWINSIQDKRHIYTDDLRAAKPFDILIMNNLQF